MIIYLFPCRPLTCRSSIVVSNLLLLQLRTEHNRLIRRYSFSNWSKSIVLQSRRAHLHSGPMFRNLKRLVISPDIIVLLQLISLLFLNGLKLPKLLIWLFQLQMVVLVHSRCSIFYSCVLPFAWCVWCLTKH